MPTPTAHERIGTRIADTYRLDRVVGRGGMGVVYAGQHVRTARPVAVKLLHGNSPVTRRRFLREAHILGETDHPNVVEVIDLGEQPDGTIYLVLELLHGEPLSAYLRRNGRLGASEALDVALPVMDALAQLHEIGVVHRDVKPANLFLAIDGAGGVVPKLLDFGISHTLARGETLTEEGALVGTPEYMSPEQVRGDSEATPAVDVWAMGVLLYECLAGQKPFAASTVGGVIARIVSERPESLAQRAPDVPPQIAAEIERALAAKPDDRPPDMRTFAEALESAAVDAGLPVPQRSSARLSVEPLDAAPEAGTSDAVESPPIEPRRRRWWAVAAVALVATATIGGVATMALGGDPPPRRRADTVANNAPAVVEEDAGRVIEAPSEAPSEAPVVEAPPAVVPPPPPPPQRRRPVQLGPNDAPIIPN